MPKVKRLLGGNYRVEYEDGAFYVGEMRNGKLNGMGSMTYTDGTIYDGIFKDDLRHGRGRAQFRSRHMEYIGEWRFDKRHGHGKETIFTDSGAR